MAWVCGGRAEWLKEMVMIRAKWMALAVMLAGGAVLFQSGCLGAFWQGATRGFPANNRWLNLAVDVANEVIFG